MTQPQRTGPHPRERLQGPLLERAYTFTREAILDDTERRVRLSFSSEEPYLRSGFLWDDDWIEILGHAEGEVDLARLTTGTAPLLYAHNRARRREDHIGVVERAWIEDKRGYAEVRLSKRADVDPLWADVKDGVLVNVSAGYQILERTLIRENKDAPNEYRVTRWRPLELSLTPLAADPTVGVGRADDPAERFTATPMEDRDMSDPTQQTQQTPNTPAERTLPRPPAAQRDPAAAAAQAPDPDALRDQILTAERSRRTEIRRIFEPHPGYDTVRDTCLDDPAVDIHTARARLLEAMGQRSGQALAGAGPRVQAGDDARDKWRAAAERALLIRAGVETNDTANDLRGHSLLEIARRGLELAGVRTAGLDRMALAQRALTLSTSDFPHVLGNVARRTLFKGYEEAEEAFQRYTKKGDLPDFRKTGTVSIGQFEQLEEVAESGEIKFASLTDENGEERQLNTFAKRFGLNRRLLVNDDLGAFSDIAVKLGQAAKRTIGARVVAHLASNPKMRDGKALFHTDHKNLLEAAAPSVASLGKAKYAMSRMKGPGGEILALRVGTLIVPAALEDLMNVLMTAQYDPDGGNSVTPNTARSMAMVATEPRLDDVSATAWYAAARGYPPIEVSYLDGNERPVVEEWTTPDYDGVQWQVRLDFGVKALDWTTLLKNPGAA